MAAFASAIKTDTGGSQVFGSQKVSWGTFTASGGATGGEVATGLNRVDFISLTAAAAAVGNNPVANETFPLQKGAVTIVCDANETGVWHAIGR